MERQQAVTGAIICEVLGVLMLIAFNRLMPPPVDLIVTGLGFLLLLAGPFFLFLRRKE